MALEYLSEHMVVMEPGPVDVHAHPRVFDPRTSDNFNPINEGEGKAGLRVYTEAALKSGFVALAIMLNETMRLYDPTKPDMTETISYPGYNLDRVRAVQAAISHEAVIPAGPFLLVDPENSFTDKKKQILNAERLFYNFSATRDDVLGLKIFGDESFGSFNIDPKHIPLVAQLWYETNPEKPVILHLEGQKVAKVLLEIAELIAELPDGKNIPIHIAHVSSREELEAVIAAKKAGMNVTCEVTVHHLFLDQDVREEIGGYGAVRPTLKKKEDIAFMWANLEYIDIIASDNAPHRNSDKASETPGLTTHTVMLPLLFAAVAQGRITMEEIYQKMCVNPRLRFNLPMDDESYTTANIDPAIQLDAQTIEDRINPGYGQNPLLRTKEKYPMVGQIERVRAGKSRMELRDGVIFVLAETSLTHLIRPKNLKAMQEG